MFRRGPQQFTWGRFTSSLQTVLVKLGYLGSIPKAINGQSEEKPHSGKLRKIDGTVNRITHTHTHTQRLKSIFDHLLYTRPYLI